MKWRTRKRVMSVVGVSVADGQLRVVHVARARSAVAALRATQAVLTVDLLGAEPELIGHEIKNHLSTFGLNLQLLAEDFHEPQNQRERRCHDRIARLLAEHERLAELANDFLRFARLGEVRAEPGEAEEVVG